MPAARRPKILILTAGFGDGHNSAAYHLGEALAPQAEVIVDDPCAKGAPKLNEAVRTLYRVVTTHAPWLWHRVYLSTERQDFSNQKLPFMRKPEAYLREKIATFQPDAVVSTYPLYPYFCDRLPGEEKPPSFIVVTDSIEINAAWRKAPCHSFLVTDDFTRDTLVTQGIPAEQLEVTGFPVQPRFPQLTRHAADVPLTPFKVLFFPTSRRPHVRRYMQALLDTDPRIEITVVLGRNVRSLYKRAKSLALEFPGRVTLKGWTRKVPELLVSHHLVVGKAGGATVHEAIAAQCPMLIHHLVPGQEEGNLALLEKIGAGQLTETAETIRSAVESLLANDAAEWRAAKRRLATHSRPAASRTAADFILTHIS